MGYIVAFFVYIFFPSIKIQGTVIDSNSNPIPNAKISVDYHEFQIDVMEDANVETISKKDGSFRARLKKSGTDYPVNVFVISGNDTIATKIIPEGKRKLNITLIAGGKK